MPSAFDWGIFVLCGLIRGTSPLVLQIAVRDGVEEPFLVVARSGPTVILFVLMMSFMYRRDPEYRENVDKHRKTPASIAKMALMGMNTLIPFICFSWALNHISSATGGVLMATTPIFGLLFSQLPWFKGKGAASLSAIKLTGMLISVLGVACIFLDELLKERSGADVVAGFFVYLAGICASAMLGLIWKKLKGDMHYTLGTMGQSVFGAVYAVLVWLAWAPAGQLVIKDGGGSPDAADWLVVLYLGVISGFGAVLAIYYLYDAIGVVRTQQVLYLVPIVSVLEAAVFQHGWAHKSGLQIILQLFGMGLVMLGLRVSKAKAASEVIALLSCSSSGGGGGGGGGREGERADDRHDELLAGGDGAVADDDDGQVYELWDEKAGTAGGDRA